MSKTRKLRKGGSRRSQAKRHIENLGDVPYVSYDEASLLPNPPRTLTLGRRDSRVRVSDSQRSEARTRTNKQIIYPTNLIHEHTVYRFHPSAIPNALYMEKGTQLKILKNPDGTPRLQPLTMTVTAQKGKFTPSSDGYYYAVMANNNYYSLIPAMKHPNKEEYRTYDGRGSSDFTPIVELLANILTVLAMGKKKTIKKRKKKQKKQKQQKK